MKELKAKGEAFISPKARIEGKVFVTEPGDTFEMMLTHFNQGDIESELKKVSKRTQPSSQQPQS